MVTVRDTVQYSTVGNDNVSDLMWYQATETVQYERLEDSCISISKFQVPGNGS